MKHFICKISAAAIVMLAVSSPAFCGLNVDVNIGIPLPLPTIIISEPPEFIFPSELGFYVAVGTDYDLFQVDNVYFIFRDNRWYKGPYYDGPWREVKHRKLPRVLRRHKYERIRYYRDQEYRHYRENNHSYRGHKGRYYRPEKRHHDRDRRDDRRDERRDDRHDKRDDRRDDRRDDSRDDRGHDGRGEGQGDWNPWRQNKGH